jgi:hypothetical protein
MRLSGCKIGIKQQSDWYSLTVRDLEKQGGSRLLAKYGYSPSKLLATVYPERKWNVDMFHRKPVGYWEDPKNHAKFMKELAKHVGVVDMEDWYRLHASHFAELGGSGLLAQFSGSPVKVLTEMFPDVHWQPWKFSNVPKTYWDHVDNQKEYLSWLANGMTN